MLLAVHLIHTGVTGAFGPALRRALAAGSDKRLTAAGAGLAVTALLQSSTATVLIVSSFAARNIIAPAGALAVMLGADVGTTLMPQLLSFNLGWMAPMFVAVGVPVYLISRGSRWRHGGGIVVGLGLLLLSLKLIVAAAAPLHGSETLASVTAALGDAPFIALLIAVALAWLAHSSLAVVLLVMSLAGTGVVSPNLAFVLVLGANIGSGIPPLVISGQDGPEGRRVPLGNLLIRSVGALAALAALEALEAAAPFVAALDPDPARQVANFHTGFNLLLAVVFLPLVHHIARLTEWILPEQASVEADHRPRYLDPEILHVPSQALAVAARETLRMGDLVEQMLGKSIEVFRSNDENLMHEVVLSDDAVDSLHEAIKLYLTEVSRAPLSEDESRRYVEILTFTINLEHIGDIIDKSLMELAAKKIREGVSFSSAGFAEISDMHASVVRNMQLALNVFMTYDIALARRLLNEKVVVRNAEISAMDRHFGRLREGLPETIETTSLHLDIIRDLRRINSHVTSAAYPILEGAGELQPSRLK